MRPVALSGAKEQKFVLFSVISPPYPLYYFLCFSCFNLRNLWQSSAIV